MLTFAMYHVLYYKGEPIGIIRLRDIAQRNWILGKIGEYYEIFALRSDFNLNNSKLKNIQKKLHVRI